MGSLLAINLLVSGCPVCAFSDVIAHQNRSLLMSLMILSELGREKQAHAGFP